MLSKRMLPACSVTTDRRRAVGSLSQSGKLWGDVVRQTRTIPFVDRNPTTWISRVAAGDAAIWRVIAMQVIAERAQILVRLTVPIRVQEIQAIFVPIIRVMLLVITYGDETSPRQPIFRPTGKQLPTHVIGDTHQRLGRQDHGAETRVVKAAPRNAALRAVAALPALEIPQRT